MASFWDMLGKVASVMQLTGVDALGMVGMVSMIVQAARTAHRNRDLCQQLANKVEIVSGLLQELQIPELRRHRKTRRPLDELHVALFNGYMLVRSCSQQQSGSQFLQMFRAANMASMLRQAKDEIDSYIILIPMITAVASITARDGETNEAAPARRPQLSIQEVHSPASSTEAGHSLELVASGSNWAKEQLLEMVLMIVQSADTARHNRDLCQQVARQALIVGSLLQGPLGTQRQLEQLEDPLFRGYMLIRFCSQYNRSQLHLIVTGADVASGFQLAQEEIRRQIYRLTNRVPAQEVHDDVTNNSAREQWLTPLAINGQLLPTDASQRFMSNLQTPHDYRIPFVVLQEATNNFDEHMLIGAGGFSKVYKAVMPDGNKVAIKRRSREAPQGLLEFRTEIKVLSKVQHHHLVPLVGYCDEHNEMILVYKYMENGTLRCHLYGARMPPLSWRKRLEICIGAAKGLHYLHTSVKPIIHRDVKSANILLDENLSACVSDFGRSKVGTGADHVSTAVEGSFGYLDPDYFRTQQLTDKADVYSFGVVLLEVICARPVIAPSLPRDEINLAVWAIDRYREGKLDQIIDPHLAGRIKPDAWRKYDETLVKCLSLFGVDRPTMGEVLWNLEFVLQLQEAGEHFFRELPREFVLQQEETGQDNSNMTIVTTFSQ